METIYNVDYFIKKFQAIPEENWCTGVFGQMYNHCANGHCGVRKDFEDGTDESTALKKLFDLLPSMGVSVEEDLLPVSWKVACVNDAMGLTAHFYPQKTPKQRILAALYDIYEKTYGRKYGEVEALKEKVIYKTVVIDSKVKELQETLTEN